MFLQLHHTAETGQGKAKKIRIIKSSNSLEKRSGDRPAGRSGHPSAEGGDAEEGAPDRPFGLGKGKLCSYDLLRDSEGSLLAVSMPS